MHSLTHSLIISTGELSQIALERAKTAREAIKIMGSLAEKYGFYSADWDDKKYGPAHAMGEGATHSLTHSPTHPLTHSLTYSLTHLLTHLLTYLLTH